MINNEEIEVARPSPFYCTAIYDCKSTCSSGQNPYNLGQNLGQKLEAHVVGLKTVDPKQIYFFPALSNSAGIEEWH